MLVTAPRRSGVMSNKEFSIVFTKWRGSPGEKRSPKRNACNSHLILKMDVQHCHRNASHPLQSSTRYQMFQVPSPFHLSEMEVVRDEEAGKLYNSNLSRKNHIYHRLRTLVNMTNFRRKIAPSMFLAVR